MPTERKEMTIKKIIAIILTIVTVISLTACGDKRVNKNIESNPAVKELDDTVREQLGDMIVDTDYEDDVYYVMVRIDSVESTLAVEFTGLDDAFIDLSETIYNNIGIENVICVVSDADGKTIVFTVYNGYNITDYMK